MDETRALGTGRKQLVVRAPEREPRETSGWSAGFFERLSECDPETANAIDELLRDLRKATCVAKKGATHPRQ